MLTNRTAFVIAIYLVLATAAFAADSPIGWAAVNALGQNGTTGGGNGPVVIVTNKADLIYYAGLTVPYTILVDGYFNGPVEYDVDVYVESDKSIIGLGAGATLDGYGLKTHDGKNNKNIIIRNLTIKNGLIDAIAIRDTHHVWIDHCDLSYNNDGLLDITKGSDYATVSWCKLHDQDKVSLVNSGTNHFEDIGKCRVTYHHNWFYNGNQRNPKVGYGKCHVFNNYYSYTYSNTVGYHTGAKVLVQNNYFYNCRRPLYQYYNYNPWEANYGDGQSIGNTFVSCTGSTTGTGISFDPTFYYTYGFALDTTADVPSLVSAGSGPAADYESVICPAPSNGSIDATTESPTLTWTDLVDETSWDVYFGTSTTPPYQTTQTTRTFSTGTLAPNTDYYWKVDANTPSGTVIGELWRFRTADTRASKPYPANGQTEAPLRINNTLFTCKPLEITWTAGLGAVAHDVYFGANPTLTASDYQDTVTTPLFAPGLLEHGTTYYWRIDTVKADDTVVPGTTWSFTTNAIVYAPIGRTEAENMVRNCQYFLEYLGEDVSGDWVVKIEAGPGVLSSIYSGPEATCNIDVTYIDESGGYAYFSLFVNETPIDGWYSSANNNQFVVHTSKTPLVPGDEIWIEASNHEDDFARTDCIDIVAVPTDDDFTPPTPNPMTWAIAPNAISSSEITMTASTAYDENGVKYYFDCITPGGHDSDWQYSPEYTDTGLTNNTSYTYKVKVRDRSVNLNETSYSTEGIATTPLYSCSEAIDSDLDDDCQVNFLDFALLAEAWVDIEGATGFDLYDLAQLATEWLMCNRDPATECWQ